MPSPTGGARHVLDGHDDAVPNPDLASTTCKRPVIPGASKPARILGRDAAGLLDDRNSLDDPADAVGNER